MHSQQPMNRRSFLKVVGVTTVGAATTIWGILGPPALGQESAQSGDLTLRGQVTADRPVPVVGATPYLEVLMVKLHPHAHKTRFVVALRFTSRDVRGARLRLKLLDAKGTLLGETVHVEELGPEVWISPTKIGTSVGAKWNDLRAIWLDLPKAARTARQFELVVEAVR